MILVEAKKELIKRYKYIYENSIIILAPYMHKETPEEKPQNNIYLESKGLGPLIRNNLNIYLK
jgi:hypothetical protein